MEHSKIVKLTPQQRSPLDLLERMPMHNSGKSSVWRNRQRTDKPTPWDVLVVHDVCLPGKASRSPLGTYLSLIDVAV